MVAALLMLLYLMSSFHLFDDHSEVDGVDLLQGFQKIGGANKEQASSSKEHISRPAFGQRGNS